MGRHWVGTSGWSYANWKPAFYPRGLKQGDWLSHYAQHLATVELNASFYRLPQSGMVERWRYATPPEFAFAVKAWRMITHQKRLKDCAQPVERFLRALETFGAKAGPVLFQCPPKLQRDLDMLRNFLDLLPAGGRYAMEFRDTRWHEPGVFSLLAEKAVAFVLFELGSQRAPRVVTTDFVYVRLHGRKERYRGAYGDEALADWAQWLVGQIDSGNDVYVYFDNTDQADHAVRDAIRLDAALKRFRSSRSLLT